MPLGAQLPVRLEIDVEERLEAIASTAGTTKSALIRLLAKTFVDHVVDSRGKVTLPPDWQELLPKSDARTTEKTEKPARILDKKGSFSSEVTGALAGAEPSLALNEEPHPNPKSSPSPGAGEPTGSKYVIKRGTASRSKSRRKAAASVPK